MASTGSSGGGMDMTQARETWEGFVRFATWGTAAIVILLIIMAMTLV